MSVVPFEPARQVALVAPSERWVALMPSVIELAKVVADTEFVPKALRHSPPAIVACILHGNEVGLGPMRSLAMIAMIDGRPSLYAEAQRALVVAHGHEMWCEDLTNTRATWAGRRAGEDRIVRTTWTMDDAKQANLTSKENWRKYPRAMLSARASADLARLHFADAIGGLAAVEEIDVDGLLAPGADLPNQQDPAPTPSPAARRRRRSPSSQLDAGPAPLRPAEAEVVDVVPLPHEDELDDTRMHREAVEANEPDVTDQQLALMQVLMRQVGVSTRSTRLEFCTQVIGRQIASSRQLTRIEASRIIDQLNELVRAAGGTPAEPVEESPPPQDAAATSQSAASSTAAAAGEAQEPLPMADEPPGGMYGEGAPS